MPLLSLRDVSFTFSHPTLLDGITIEIEQGERIGLLGRNGAGKSTLMKLLAGELPPDNGAVIPAAGLRLARLIQEVPQDSQGTVAEMIAAGVRETGVDSMPASEPEDDWKTEHAVERMVSRLKLDGDSSFGMSQAGAQRTTRSCTRDCGTTIRRRSYGRTLNRVRRKSGCPFTIGLTEKNEKRRPRKRKRSERRSNE